MSTPLGGGLVRMGRVLVGLAQELVRLGGTLGELRMAAGGRLVRLDNGLARFLRCNQIGRGVVRLAGGLVKLSAALEGKLGTLGCALIDLGQRLIRLSDGLDQWRLVDVDKDSIRLFHGVFLFNLCVFSCFIPFFELLQTSRREE